MQEQIEAVLERAGPWGPGGTGRGDFPAARRRHERGGQGPPGICWRAASSAATEASCRTSSTGPTPSPRFTGRDHSSAPGAHGNGGRRAGRRAGAGPGQRHGRICRRRQGIRRRPRGHGGDAPALGERDREPRLRHRGVVIGRRHHLGGEQPREPVDPVLERPGERPHGRGCVPPGRGVERRVVRDARPHPPRSRGAVRGAPRRGRLHLRLRRPRHRPRARGVRGP
jgi:hypothetical protein